MDARHRQGLGHRRVLDAARCVAGADRSRGGQGPQSGRTQEIQRLIGRSLRAVTDLEAMGEVQITLDCDVLQADGGTRTASICGAYVALHDACTRLVDAGRIPAHPSARLAPRCRSAWSRVGHARPGLQRGQPGRGGHERRDDRVGPLRRGPGDRRGEPFAGRELDEMLSLAEPASPRSSTSRPPCSPSPGAMALIEFVLATANPDKAGRSRDPRSHRELLARPADVPDVDETG